ncbi:MAG: cell division/cell wall cluster transcriptional repressor MraZ [Paludibacter sp.]|jgi:MraZ protein|nr:cell division/cell wall cluster transcriptional repressor MraZ [Paludibacter sp.]
MSTFLGKYEAKLDVKGRVFIPASFRKLLANGEQEKVVLRKDTKENCLIVYPEQIWNRKVEEMLQKFNEYKGKNAAALAAFTGKAEWLDIDAQGRVLLKQRHLEAIGIENSDIVFEGRIDRFAIWSKAQHTANMMSDEELAALMEETM